ncbi:hypothetical protein [Streptosporangium vulgare]|uniref:hypothetical protein n=1 Tax=Streptosporangium vulgare TaxID=46190 RepID=UPI0031DB7E4B
MRRRLFSMLAAVAVACASVGAAVGGASAQASASGAGTAVTGTGSVTGTGTTGTGSVAAAESYEWKNVRIDGGGFVPGIIFNQKEQNLIYARTDIGGAYRWEQSSKSWIPLLDWVGWDKWGYNGVVSLATDPVETNRVYVAAGMYTNSWDPNNGAILRSADKGATWQATPLPFKLGGNMPGRGMGERLAVDPNRNSVVYFGRARRQRPVAQHRQGRDLGQGHELPQPGELRRQPLRPQRLHQPPSGRGLGDLRPQLGDRRQHHAEDLRGRRRQAEHRLQLLGRRDHLEQGRRAAHRLHRAQGRARPRQPHPLHRDQRHRGPLRRRQGRRVEAQHHHRAWTQISPVPSSSADDYFGYSGLTIDRQNPGTIMVATQISWWPDVIFFRSTDSGATWTRIWDFTSYPERSFRYTMDISSAPWLTFGTNPQPAGGNAQARLDDRVAGDRPVRRQPDDVRHRRHRLRHRGSQEVGHRRQAHHQAHGQGA